MARVGDVIENPIEKYRVKFLEISDQLLKLEWTIEAGGSPPPWHIHLVQDERFTVQSGQLGVRHDKYDNITILNPGEEFYVKSPHPHQFFNASETEAVTFIFDVIPAGQFATFLQTYFGLAREGEIRASRIPNDILLGFILGDISDTYPAWGIIPAYIMKFTLKVLATFSRLTGRKALPDRFNT